MLLHPLAVSTLLLVASLGLATALLAAVPRQAPDVGDAHRIWSLGLFFAPLGWTLLELGALMPSNGLSVAAKTALAAGFGAYLIATARLAGLRVGMRWTAMPVLFVLAASLWVRWQDPNVPMRTGLVSVVCALFTAGVAVMALRAARNAVPQASTLAIAFVVSTLALATRAALLLAPHALPLHAWLDVVEMHSVLLGAAILAPALATLAFLLAGSAARESSAPSDA